MFFPNFSYFVKVFIEVDESVSILLDPAEYL